MPKPVTCLACSAPALEVGHYAGALCLTHALVAAKAKAVRIDPKATCYADGMSCTEPPVTTTPHGGYCQAHRPGMPTPTAHAASTVGAMPTELLDAVLVAMRGLDARPIRAEPRYGTLNPTVRPITATDDPLEPCGLCGATSPRTKRAPYGLGGGQVWVLCQSMDQCMTRLRKAKAA